ncbi:MAG: hypothetical protein MOIL_00339 [Candidatus Methanolliviera sp. GoM_oil]|nr:MAG: hypothetical protein MOIL_00339 [Candidatus Methanolliviera sp. GoM_oil]
MNRTREFRSLEKNVRVLKKTLFCKIYVSGIHR